jgi:ATP phosphoribosyltransferase
MTRLRIAVQSKGRLAESSMDLFKKCGLRFAHGRNNLHQRVENMAIDLMLVRDDDIPNFIANGACDYGIVGENVYRETGCQETDVEPLEIALRLGFAKCTLKLATPVAAAVKSVEELDGLKIATSYPQITRCFLASAGIGADVVEMRGSVEVAPRLKIADAICDLVSSGATLEANGLEAIATVFESEAVLIRRKNQRNPAVDEIAAVLMRRAEGVIASARTKYILLNAPATQVDAITALLPGADAPTVSAVAGRDDIVAIHAVCRERVFWKTLEALEHQGAKSILVLPIEKMLA